jgi:hypothetical protein
MTYKSTFFLYVHFLISLFYFYWTSLYFLHAFILFFTFLSLCNFSFSFLSFGVSFLVSLYLFSLYFLCSFVILYVWNVYLFCLSLYFCLLTCICLSRRLFRVTLKISRAECNIDVTPGTLTATDTCIGYHETRFEASGKVILHTRYVSACVGAGGGRGRGTKIKTKVILHTRYVSTCVRAGGGRGRGTKIKTKANRCGACYYSIMFFNVWQVCLA